jgi:subtilisin-like proprotein convertase family protein
VPAGHKLGFALRWSSAEDSGTSEPIFLDVGEPACETVAASDLPQTISYIVTAVSQVQATSGPINEIRVTVDIRHNFIGDVQAVLSSPAGTSVVLHNNTGGSADDIVGTYGVDLTPAESLDAFIGQAAAGTWTLTVGDSVIVNNGSLEAWSLEVCGVPAEATTPEMRFRDLERTGAGALLEWWTYPGLSSYRVYRSTDPSSAAAFVDVTAEDGDTGDTVFLDTSTEALSYFLVTGVGQQGEGPKGHFGE